jgi:hypothetical protein
MWSSEWTSRWYSEWASEWTSEWTNEWSEWTSRRSSGLLSLDACRHVQFRSATKQVWV